MQAYRPASKPIFGDFLAPPPRAGELSIQARKYAALAFVLLCTVVVWGSVVNRRSNFQSTSEINFEIAWGVILMILYVVYLIAVYWGGDHPPFGPKLEMLLIIILSILWIPLVGVVSSRDGFARDLTIWFSWLGFFGSWYAALKAYHCWMEKDLPTPNPEGLDDEDHVYG